MVKKEKEKESEKEKKEGDDWIPKTSIGKKVKNGEITSMEQLIKMNAPIIEPQIVDILIPSLEEKVVDLKKSTRVTRAGRKFTFRAGVLIGDKEQFIGIGTAKDKEKFPAIRKAAKRARLNLVKVRKGCGSWECTCGMAHSVPFKVTGKCASVKVTLKPAPKGTGLVVGENIKDVMEFAGIKDVWSETKGSTGTKLNFVRAAIDALRNTIKMKGVKKE